MDGAHALLPPPADTWKIAERIDSGARAWNETGPLQGKVERQALQGGAAARMRWPFYCNARGGAAVLGDSDLARNTLFGRAGNRALLLGLINWLTDNRLSAASAADDTRIDWSTATGASLALFHLLLGPLALAGLWLWIQRRRRRG